MLGVAAPGLRKIFGGHAVHAGHEGYKKAPHEAGLYLHAPIGGGR
jgi:hypothetical protein